jgi:Fe-S cluster biogenesis protein NfuA/nitrite reductase/ring-hydroxylating ferredoxin subunit
MAEGPPGFPRNEVRPGAAVDGEAQAFATLDDGAARERVARVDALLEEVEGAIGAVPVDTALELVQALLELYGEGLARVVGHVAARDDDGALARAFAGDELVSHLLLLHGLHPEPLEVRVRAALDEVRPYLESHGGDVELLEISADGVVRLALRGSCDGCASSSATMALAIEEAIRRAAPDIAEVVAEGAAEPPPAPLLQIDVSPGLQAAPVAAATAPANGGAAWTVAGAAGDLAGDGPVLRTVGRAEVLFVTTESGRYAYRPACPACRASLAAASLAGDALACAACGAAFDVRRAGRALDGGGAHLEPVPLLVAADGTMRVALGAAS